MNNIDLIKILLDKKAYLGDRHDAAGYLSDFNDDETINALFQVACDPSEDDMISGKAGESLGILLPADSVNLDDVNLQVAARDELLAVWREKKANT